MDCDEEFTYVVERNGQMLTLENVIQNPPRIAQVLPKSAAIAAGLEKGRCNFVSNSEKLLILIKSKILWSYQKVKL